MELDRIDWDAPEESSEVRRPFTVKVEESVARGFIHAVQSRGLYVRETMVKLMREFIKIEGVEDVEPTRTENAGAVREGHEGDGGQRSEDRQ
jgi:hypothetical protein